MSFEAEGLGSVGGLGAAVAVDAGQGGVDAVVDADAFGEADLDASEAAVDVDDGTVADVGIAQVEPHETEADVHVGALERLAVVAVFLLAKIDFDIVIEDDRGSLLAVVTADATLLVAEKQERQAPDNGNEAKHILPNVVPGDDAAGSQKQQYADAAADDGAGLAAVVEDVDETGNDDEKSPPAFETDADDVDEFEGPHDAEGHESYAANDFAGTFHCVSELFLSLLLMILNDLFCSLYYRGRHSG